MQSAVRAVILGSAGQDLFVAPNAPFTSTSTHISLQLDVFPLVRLVWTGALLLVAGAAVSLWPRSRRAAASPRPDSRRSGTHAGVECGAP